MPPKTRQIQQNLIDEYHPNIRVQDEVMESTLTQEMFDEFFQGTPTPRRVGLAPIYSKNGTLSRLVLATQTNAIIIHFHAKDKGAKAYQKREVLTSAILCNEDVTLLGFDLAKLAIALFADHSLRILNGVDIQSAFGVPEQPALAAIQFAVGENAGVLEENVDSAFAISDFDDKKANAVTSACTQQAWVAQVVATYPGMEERVLSAVKINTRDMNETRLRIITELERGEQRVALGQATSVVHDFSAVGARNQTAHVRADRFQNRFQQDGGRTQHLGIHDPETRLNYTVPANLTALFGRNATLQAGSSLEGRIITSITTQGADRPTNAQRQRDRVVREVLQGKADILQNPFLQYIFDPSSEFSWPETFPVIDTPPPVITTRPLNDSQQRAVEHMLLNTNQSRFSLIHGPPGTGKTTVIAAYVCSAVAAGATGIWLVAQSNIAVKNIAEKLANVGFLTWRLLVSKDFHFGWHEHLYGNIAKNVISTSNFRAASRDQSLTGIPVILCTLSMLSNTKLDIFTKRNPIQTLVVDEASQIAIGNYVSPLQNFPSISKLCMIGDHKQLPPYGADDDDTIKSVFEIDHLRDGAIFLSIQYRMPPLIGDVVSDVMYEGQLQSNPEHPVPSTQASCWFVHVEDSGELQHETSWHNPVERATVLKLAEKLQAEGKEYCIITPYDAQRTFLENELKSSGLVWEDKCFNVDSFQGNEKDFIIISLVRSRGLGFLADERRTNVMLTRCKRGMYIVTSWDFVWKKASQTMVGRMAAAWSDNLEEVWVNPEHLTIAVEA